MCKKIMKTILASLLAVVVLLIAGCIEPKDFKDKNEQIDFNLVEKLCNEKKSSYIFPNETKYKHVSEVYIYTNGKEYYYGADWVSYGFSGWTNLYDSNGKFAIKMTGDDIANNDDPCYDANGNKITCPTYVKTIKCNGSKQTVSRVYEAVNKTIAQGSDEIYAADGSKKQIVNECVEEPAKTFLDNSSEIEKAEYWLSQNHSGEKVFSWWDYGTALECSGLKPLITSKNLGDQNILEVANLFINANETEFLSFMKANDIKYVMISSELIKNPYVSEFSFGGMYRAIDYLACVRNNQSDCEKEHLWKTDNKTSSILYKSIVLGKLDGFSKVYEDQNKVVKVFEINVSGKKQIMSREDARKFAMNSTKCNADGVSVITNTSISDRVPYQTITYGANGSAWWSFPLNTNKSNCHADCNVDAITGATSITWMCTQPFPP